MFGVYLLDLQAVARALAETVIRDFDPSTLEIAGTHQYLRTKYMRLVAEYGLPARACNRVAGMALRLVLQAAGENAGSPPPFAFYD